MLLSRPAEYLAARISLHLFCALAFRVHTVSWHKGSTFYHGLYFNVLKANSIQNIWTFILSSGISNIQRCRGIVSQIKH